MCAGVAAFAWPFPLLTLNEPYSTWYCENVLMVDSKPGGASAALPFLWMLTAPFGAVLATIGIPILYWGQHRT